MFRAVERSRQVSGLPGAQVRLSLELAMDRVLDKRYRVVNALGTGGSSQVYLAEDQLLGRHVAIKVLDPEAARDGELRRRFVREARALAQLQHPNIVAVFDVGEVDGLPYFVMERLEGGSLKEKIEREGPLEIAEALRITAEIASGLDAAHARGIVHADMKPSNILFDHQGRAKIADFGIARTPQDVAETPQLFATALYVAPERVSGKPATHRSDIYGLGLILYEMLAGKPPFTSSDPSVLLRDHAVRPPTPPSQVRPSVTRELDGVVLKALTKDPGLRYGRASDLVRAFAKLQGVDDPLAPVRAYRTEDLTTIMPAPLEGLLPYSEESPVVALLARYAWPIRRVFFSALLVAPLWALLTLAGVPTPYTALISGLPVLVALAGHLSAALAIAWVMQGLLLLLFVPVLAALFLVGGLWLALREYSAEQAIFALATPVLASLGLAPAAILAMASLHGLAGILTVAWAAILTVSVGLVQGLPSSGSFVVTGLLFQQPNLLDTQRAIQARTALADLFRSNGSFLDRAAPLGAFFDPKVLTDQLLGLVSRLAGAELTATIGTLAAWVLAGALVWTVARVFRLTVDTLFRPRRWFALYVLASVFGIFAGALFLYLMFVTWDPLAEAPERFADSVLFLAALVGAVFAMAVAVVIGPAQPIEPGPGASADLSPAAREVQVRG